MSELERVPILPRSSDRAFFWCAQHDHPEPPDPQSGGGSEQRSPTAGPYPEGLWA